MKAILTNNDKIFTYNDYIICKDTSLVINSDELLSRTSPSVFIYNGFLYICGGQETYGSGYSKVVEKIDLNLTLASYENLGEIMPHGVVADQFAFCTSTNTFYSLFGSMEGASYGGTKLMKYNLTTGVWTELPTNNIFYKSGGELWSDGRYLYAAGGIRNNSSGQRNDTYKFDMVNETFEYVTNFPIIMNGYGRHSAYDSVNRKAYILGDYSGGTSVHKQFWEYDLDTDTYTALPLKDDGIPQGASACAYYNGNVFIAGGGHPITSNIETNKITKYNLGTGVWSDTGKTLSIPRTYVTSAIHGFYWYIVGGYSYTTGDTYNKIDRIDLAQL